jgi:hypothetical protein
MKLPSSRRKGITTPTYWHVDLMTREVASIKCDYGMAEFPASHLTICSCSPYEDFTAIGCL